MGATETAETEKKSMSKSESVFNAQCYVAGKKINSEYFLEVKSPYDNRIVGTVALANASNAQQAIDAALAGGKTLTRYERFSILDKAKNLLVERREEFANCISAES